MPAFGEPRRYRRKHIASVKGFAERLEKIVFGVGMAHDDVWFALVNEREHAVIGRNEIVILPADEQRAALRSHAGVDDHHVNCLWRKVRISRANGQRAIEQIEGRHVMRYVDEGHFRIDLENDAL